MTIPDIQENLKTIKHMSNDAIEEYKNEVIYKELK